ncbi:MAG: DmsC/YnfH family molybdoenzyme membrane anchor subunit [Chthoniobacter sp.]|uniref:DmsC/YnfH family molybdoenzyme membrane anchor subunit n=1 Tax=Chthoniobacter sp. TaxID=2510640 RepID=UPI0032A8B21A
MTLSSEPTTEKSDHLRTLIDELLDEQQRMTPVERFARKHDLGDVPAQARYYHDLIPQTKPGPGQQYAFAVDLDACTGCKACVSACHSLNGLEEHETWRSVGLLHGNSDTESYRQTITTACHHCVEPGCLEGCPVMAYDKDEETGIVRHLDDQCIGCQYCVLKCPYDVPKYSERLGIVRKCDMCIGRLGAGEAPACVQACPHEAITIELVDRAEVLRRALPETEMVPGAFDSSYTKPTTRFFSASPLPANAEAGDESALRLEHAHWPLVGMLLLTQMAAGLFVAVGIGLCGQGGIRELRGLGLIGWLALHLGLVVSILHLGRPLGAWRFFLGLRTSWMSREILAFSVFSMLASATLAGLWLSALPASIAPAVLEPLLAMVSALLPILGGVTAFVGLASVFTSVMIYVDTRRPYWGAAFTAPKFFGATFLLGCLGSAMVLELLGARKGALICIALATAMRVALFVWETAVQGAPAARRATRTVQRYLPWVPRAATVLFAASIMGCALAVVTDQPWTSAAMVVALGSTFSALLIERFCFFTTCPAPRMPGGVAA